MTKIHAVSGNKIYLIIGLYILWIILFSFGSYQYEKQQRYTNLDRHLESAALTVPLLLPDGFHHQGLSQSAHSNEQDIANIVKLSKLTRHSDIVYIYSLILQDGEILFTSSSATDKELENNTDLSHFWDVYDDVDPQVFDVFKNKAEAYIEYKDKWGHFRSVFIPITSEDGRTYVVGADLDISYIQAILNKDLYTVLSISAVFVLLAIFLVLAYSKNSRKLASTLEKQVKSRTAKLALSESKVNSILEHSPVGIFHYDFHSALVTVNKQFEQLIGSPKEVLIGFNMLDNLVDEQMLNALRQSLSGQVGFYEGFYKSVTGNKEVYLQADFVPMLGRQGEIIGGVGVFNDITLRKKAEEELQLFARVFSDTHEGITITDADMNIIDINPAFSDITGYSRDDIIGKNPQILSSGKQTTEFYQDMWQQLNEQGHWQGEVWNRKKQGELYAELLTISALKDSNDKVVNYVGVFSDITSSKQQQDQLHLMAHYDVLTGLPNRALFSDRFHQAIAHSKRTDHQLAICFLDIDNFKPVNDNYGHEVGDKLLIEVAKRITSCIREEDTVSRQGGDEFALLLNDIESQSQCEKTLERIHFSLAQAYIIDDYPHKITVSSGVTLYPDDDGDIDTLLRHADQAMYQAKLTGKQRYKLFNPEHDHRTIQKHHELEIIEQALVNNEFQLYYQPKVNMVTGEVFGAEALIRWIHPEKGLIPPLDFLPTIEGTKLEINVGNWVINEALSQLEIWHQQGMRPEVSVNISSHHLLSENFFTDLDIALAQHSTVDSQCFQLEILESSALGDLNVITSIIKACQRTLGVKVALDDFGTGYSSLTHLKNLPANTIKIDQSFVRNMIDDPSDFAIIDGIIGLSDSFNREVIAEGVETTNHGLMLLIMGCEQAQGYGIAKPMPADDYPQWLNDYAPNQEWLLCGNKHRTTKENKIKLFKLITQQWKNRFISNIQSASESIDHWPIMDDKHCPGGMWIQRAIQEQLFELDDLDQLIETHEALHLIAQGMLKQYQDGDIDTAREGLPELQTAFDKMNNALDLFV